MPNFDTPANDRERQIWALWKKHGGSQYGPRVEQAVIGYQDFYKFCDDFAHHERASALRDAQKIATEYLFVDEIEEATRALADAEERLANV